MNNSAKLKEATPVSRFWACLFSCTIFALLWTQKIKKTRKWIILIVVYGCIVISNFIFYTIPDVMDSEDIMAIEPSTIFLIMIDYVLNDVSSDNAYSEDFVYDLSLFFSYVHDLVWIVWVSLLIFLMYKWSVQYNLDTFGYKSKKEWKKANSSQESIGKKIKRQYINIVLIIRNIGKKTNEKIPTEKIKDASSKAGEKIAHNVNNLKYKSKMSEDEKMRQIKEWHNLMLLGVISKSDYESKKTQLIKSE